MARRQQPPRDRPVSASGAPRTRSDPRHHRLLSIGFVRPALEATPLAQLCRQGPRPLRAALGRSPSSRSVRNVPSHRPDISAATGGTRGTGRRLSRDRAAHRRGGSSHHRRLLRAGRHDITRAPRATRPTGAHPAPARNPNEDEAYAAAGLHRETAPAAIARGEAPGTEPARACRRRTRRLIPTTGCRCATITTADSTTVQRRVSSR
jgi:hypothetical protein